MYAYFLDASHGIVIEKMNFDVQRWLKYISTCRRFANSCGLSRFWIRPIAAIRSTERLIAKLEQVRQGLLHDLLTRGVDESGRLRDPDRLRATPFGLVPMEWAVGPLDSVLTRIDAGKSPRSPRPTGPSRRVGSAEG